MAVLSTQSTARQEDEELLLRLDLVRRGMSVTEVAQRRGASRSNLFLSIRRVKADDLAMSGEPADEVSRHYPTGRGR